MSVSLPELKALLLKSGNRCAFPGCGAVLFQSGDDIENVVNRSEIAHIVAQSPDGPRGQYPLPMEERDKESNLILLCEEDHHRIDSKPQYYTVERLRQIKEDHEARIQEATGKAVFGQDNSQQRQQYVKETVYSTLFNVIRLPNYVYGAVCRYTDASHEEIRQLIVPPADPTEIYPYIIQGKELYAFQDLKQSDSPFQKLVDSNTAQLSPTREWWDDPVKLLWFTDLLNRSLHKLTGRKGLQWDNDHKRYYFKQDEPGRAKEVSYRPLNKSMDTKQVVWQPHSKRTGQPRPYWLHRAVSLRFHPVSSSSSQWCLSMRPEFRVTKDGVNLDAAEKIGSRITRKKSRMYNYDLLGEVNFWRDFLGDSSPRITMNYGQGQYVIISTEMMPTEIEWPGIPEQYAKPFKNVEYAETLFTWAEVANLESDIDSNSDDSEDKNWEEGDEDGE